MQSLRINKAKKIRHNGEKRSQSGDTGNQVIHALNDNAVKMSPMSQIKESTTVKSRYNFIQKSVPQVNLSTLYM